MGSWLQKVHPESAKAPTTVVTKMLIDQLIFAPLATLVFYAYKCAAERRFRCAGGGCPVKALEAQLQRPQHVVTCWCTQVLGGVALSVYLPDRRGYLWQFAEYGNWA